MSFTTRVPRLLDYKVLIGFSAFLLFAIEPIAGKHVLPFLGGSSSVWATCLSFFTAVLFVGYMYVYFLRKYPLAKQAEYHTYIIGVGLIVWLLQVHLGTSLLPKFDSMLVNVSSPVFSVLTIMTLYIGFPFFILATTSSLLQQWYALTHEKEPYSLYTLSNIGSLTALLVYPFLIEPKIPVSVQEYIWTFLFVGYAIAYAFFAKSVGKQHEHRSKEKEQKISIKSAALWTALAAFPSFVLIAATSHITTIIAPLPMLWVLPLALYLISFIVTFAGGTVVGFWSLILVFLSFFLLQALDGGYSAITMQLFGSVCFVGFVGMAFHAKLYELRPHHSQSAKYYAAISFGGMIGTFLASICMPLMLDKIIEFYWVIALAALCAVFFLPNVLFQSSEDEKSHWVYRACFAIVLWYTLSGFIPSYQNSENAVHVSRNFYGATEVREYDDHFSLMHGNTMHGVEAKDDAESRIPSSYYTTDSGVGRAIRLERALKGTISVGTVGLGTGTIAAYCQPRDHFTFYEIDTRMVMIANTYFNNLHRCADATIHLGDARLTLQREDKVSTEPQYDVLAIDAFSDDSIPMHLLTKEAVALYLRQVNDSGIVAVHVSNRYLDLAPVVHRIARELQVPALTVSASGDGKFGSASTWVVLTKNPKLFLDERFADIDFSQAPEEGPLWTDDFNAMSSVVTIPMPRVFDTIASWIPFSRTTDEEEETEN